MVRFKTVESSSLDYLLNIKLLIDGVDIEKKVIIDDSNYLEFDLLSNPISLFPGTHTIDLVADIKFNAVGEKFIFSLENKSDINLIDPISNTKIEPTINSGLEFSSRTAGTIIVI